MLPALSVYYVAINKNIGKRLRKAVLYKDENLL